MDGRALAVVNLGLFGHHEDMRANAFWLSVALAGCSGEPERPYSQPLGWSASADHSHVFYKFSDADGTFFSGRCDAWPIFGLYGGDYPQTMSTFDLVIDGRKWTLEAFQGEHGGALIVDKPRMIRHFYNAKRQVSFRVGGNWVWAFSPGTTIKDFIENCNSIRSRPARDKID